METTRRDNRRDDELRRVRLEWDFQPNADSSLLIRMGDTHVVCAVTIEKKVPPFLKDTGRGWITAEYGMLPCSASSRMAREAARGPSGRTHEIQRLIGRSLRMMVDLSLLGERTLRVDCDVIRADGGTRTASITGAALAIRAAIAKLQAAGDIGPVSVLPVAAVSVGMVDGRPLLDLDYEEDSKAEVDANFVMTGDGRFIEIQCTAEGSPLQGEAYNALAELAGRGIDTLLAHWREPAGPFSGRKK
jgi:ribonuclease PH